MSTDTRSHLESEIRSARSKFLNGVNNRKVHPTFGYTKASLAQTLHHLEGLLAAHRILFDINCPNVPWISLSDYAYVAFDFDLTDLHVRYKNA